MERIIPPASAKMWLVDRMAALFLYNTQGTADASKSLASVISQLICGFRDFDSIFSFFYIDLNWLSDMIRLIESAILYYQ
jgi:hypothetical protein